MIWSNQSNAFIFSPNLDGVTINIAACFHERGIIIGTLDDHWRAAHAVITVQRVETICDHKRGPIDITRSLPRSWTPFLTFVKWRPLYASTVAFKPHFPVTLSSLSISSISSLIRWAVAGSVAI